MATETVYAFDQIAVDDPQYTSAQQLNWLWQSLRRNDGVAQDLDLALSVTSDGIGNVLTQNGAAFLLGRSYLLSGGPLTTALTPLPATDFRTAYAVVVRFTTGTATGTIVTIAGSTIANPGPAVNPSIVAATDVLLAYVLAVNTAGTIVYTVTDSRAFQSIGPQGLDTYFGHSALSLNYASTGAGFTAFGYQSLQSASTTTASTAFGYQTLKALTTGIRNSGGGYQSLTALTTGTDNTGFGHSALTALTTSVGSTAMGSSAGAAASGGGVVTAFGYQALKSSVSATANTAVGFQALSASITPVQNTAVGFQALALMTTSDANVAIGFNTLSAANGGGSGRCVAVGANALALGTVGLLVAVGFNALAANSTGAQNTAVGYQALATNTTGSDSTAIGYLALNVATTGIQNTAIGSGALNTTTTGVNNTGLGFGAISTSATASNQITLGNSSVTIIRAQVTGITALSDRRDKTDIVPLPSMLDIIREVNPVMFRWDMRERYATKDEAGQVLRDADGFPIYDGTPDGTRADDHFTLGTISQELKELQERFKVPYLNLVHDVNPNRIEATPSNLLLPAIKAIQELADKLDALTAKVEGLTRA